MLDLNNTSRVMPWPKTGATHYHALLPCTDKDRAINWLVVSSVVWLGSMISGMDLCKCKVCGLVPCCSQDGCRAQVPNTGPHRFKRIHISYQPR